MAKQGYPSSGGRFGAHPGVGGYPVVGSRFGSHPDSSSSAPVTPLTILGSLAWWVRADMGITLGTGVSAWADQVPAGTVNFANGTGAAQPAFIASAINGHPAVRSDGVDDVLSAPWVRAAPGTQPFYIWLVCKQLGWGALRSVIGDIAVSGFTELQNGSSPTLQAWNSSSNSGSNAGGIIGSYFRHEMQFSNATSDYLKIGSVNATGTSASNDAGGGQLQLFNRGNSAASRYWNGEIAEAFGFLGTPTAQERADLDAYVTERYGPGLV